MRRSWKEKLEDMMAAVAFAEAGDMETAVEIMRPQRPQKVARKRARREKRIELRAPGAMEDFRK